MTGINKILTRSAVTAVALCAFAASAQAWSNAETANMASCKNTSLKDNYHMAVNYEWLADAKIKPGEASITSFSELGDRVEEKIKALLRSSDQTSHEAALARRLYNMAADWEARDKCGYAPIIPYIERIEKISNIDELTAYLCDSSTTHFGSILCGMGTTPDNKDATSFTVAVTTCGLTLSDADEYRAEKLSPATQRRKDANEALLSKMLNKLGRSESEIKEMNASLMRVEKILAENAMGIKEIHSPEARLKRYNVRTREELENESPVFPLVKLLDSEGYGASHHFVLFEPKWLVSLNALYKQENLKDIKNFLLARTLLATAGLLDTETRLWNVERSNYIMGSTGHVPDDTYAYSMTDGYLSEIVGRMYVDAYGSKQIKCDVEKIISQIVDYYRAMIQEKEWLLPETRKKALTKLSTLIVRAAYPDKWEDYSALDFRDFAHGGSLVEMASAVGKFEHKLDVRYVNQKVDRTKWIMAPQTVNACYCMSDNSINIPLGILGGVFYSVNRSYEENIAAIGMVIAHEITHAFDTNGSQYDENGNLNNWWTESDRNEFNKRARAISDYYSTLEAEPGVPIDGELVLSEAIADLGAIHCTSSIGRKVQGFEFDKFFRSFASVWRARATKELEQFRIKQNVHPLNFMRTNVNVQQVQEFYDTYDIHEGDGMYLAPEKRLKLW